jgi:hypothetical protein
MAIFAALKTYKNEIKHDSAACRKQRVNPARFHLTLKNQS